MSTAGLFFSHVRSPRVAAHYRRLVHETEGMIAWRFAYNAGSHPAPELDVPYAPPAQSMPARYAEAMRNGGICGGYIDTVIIPCVLALDAEFTWVMEYDVDFSGCWRTLFGQFEGGDADLLTTTLVAKPDSPSWSWWRTARAPPGLPQSRMLRDFHPIMRLSHGLACDYRRITLDPAWGGHCEFTLPTVAACAGRRLQDIGGGGANYLNDPRHPHLTPGTFRWRPSKSRYFHEAPRDFQIAEKLYHPIKPGVAEWDTQR